MSVADAWATSTTTITSAKRQQRAAIAAQVAQFLSKGGQIKVYGPTGAAELERKRKKGGKKAQRVIELGRNNTKDKLS